LLQNFFIEHNKIMKNKFFYNSIFYFFCFFILWVSGCSFITVSLTPTTAPLEEKTISGKGKDKILIVDVSGIISGEKEHLTGFIEEIDMVTRIKEELTDAAQDEAVKAVILRINSPGGAVTASDTIYHEIVEFKKKTGKKVIACIMDLGTSGGYYVAVSADKIIAHPTSVTGSIGVIMLNLSVDGLLQKIGVADTSIKTGKYKDMGSPLKSMTNEERQIFLSILDNMYERFLSVIMRNRNTLSREELNTLADGRIYSSEQALQYELIDHVGYLEDAVWLAKKESDLKDARVIMYHRPGAYKNNIYSQLNRIGTGEINIFNIDLKTLVNTGSPTFMYLWAP